MIRLTGEPHFDHLEITIVITGRLSGALTVANVNLFYPTSSVIKEIDPERLFSLEKTDLLWIISTGYRIAFGLFVSTLENLENSLDFVLLRLA